MRSEFLIVAMIQAMAMISPGPDLTIVLNNSLSKGLKAGVLTGLGVSLGASIHMFYTAWGLGNILKQSPLLFEIIKYSGTIFLLYLGSKLFLSTSTGAKENLTKRENKMPFITGLLTNLLNPKAILFTISFFSNAISPNTSINTKYYYCLQIGLIGFFWFFIVSKLFSIKKIQNLYQKFHSIFNKCFGLILFSIAIKIILEEV